MTATSGFENSRRGGGAIRQGRLTGGRRDTSMSALHLTLLENLGVRRDRFADAKAPLDLS